MDLEPQPQYVVTAFAVEFHISKIVAGQPVPAGQIVINLPLNLYPTDLTTLIPNIVAQAQAMDAHAAS